LLLVAADFAYSLPRGTLGTDSLDYRLWLGEAALLVLMALGVAWAWIRDRRTRSAVVRLVMDAAHSPPPGGLREVLAGLLGDTDLELAYPVGEPSRQVRADGQPTTIDAGIGQATTPLIRSGRTVAMLRHRAGLLDDPGTVREIAAAARLSMDNERLRAEVLAQLEDLRAARARIVATGDAERRRLERDLHDGAQQRLVGLSLTLRMVRPEPVVASRLAGLIDQAHQELRLAIDELRELAHGIYPAVLADEGLAAAVEALAEGSKVPVSIGQLSEERLPDPVEAAAYFLVAEVSQLAEAARAAGVRVDTQCDGNRLRVNITQSGGGEASEHLEAELRDVADRVGALGGELGITGLPGDAISICAEIPCGS
jgi:signal transduction histidine kinase